MQIHIAKNGQRMGPYSETQVREMLAAGSIATTDLAWYEGMADWKPVGEVLPASTAPGVAAPSVPPVTPSPVAPPPGATFSPVVRPIDPNLAGRGSRLLAFLIDGFIFTLCCVPGGIMLWMGADDHNDTLQIIGGILIGVLFLALMVLQIYLLSTRGQTIGKKMMSVKIVKYADDSNPGFVHACLLRLIVPGFINGIPFIGYLFPIVDACFIFGEERRCVHDLIASTKVVNA
jgi:uncharacterized RDD family membrane protein YckC